MRGSCILSKKVQKGIDDLGTTHTELAKEWHQTKNKNVFPCNVSRGSHFNAWWTCSDGHEYQSVVKDRVKGRGCPYCSGKRVLVGYNDLATLDPVLCEEWNYAKNGDLTPKMVTRFSNKKVWWTGSCGHEWPAKISARSMGGGCPICWASKQTSFAEQAVYFYVSKCFFDALSRDSSCGKELDVFIPSINKAIEYDGAYFHKNKKTADLNKNKWCEEKGITLFRIREKGCPDIGHENIFIRSNDSDDALNDVISLLLNALGCVITNDFVNVIRDSHEITELYRVKQEDDSFAVRYPELVNEWHPVKNGSLHLEMFSHASGYNAWWICSKGHEYQSKIHYRTRGHGCPVCANQQVLEGYNDLMTVYPEVVREWHPTKNGDLKPSDVIAGSINKVWWKCPICGHEVYEGILRHCVNGYCTECSNRQKVMMSKKAVRCEEMNIVYSSIDDAGLAIGVEASHISACLHGRQNTAGGYHWSFVEKMSYPENVYVLLGLSKFLNFDSDLFKTKIDLWFSKFSLRDQDIFFRYFRGNETMPYIGESYGLKKQSVWQVIRKLLSCIERHVVYDALFGEDS